MFNRVTVNGIQQVVGREARSSRALIDSNEL